MLLGQPLISSDLVQSLNSPFFPPHIGTEPGRSKRETLFSPARVQPLYGAGRKESTGTGLLVIRSKRRPLTSSD